MSVLEHIGERKAIELIMKHLDKMPNMPIPFGDDVAGYPVSNDQLAVLKTDMLVGKTDVPPKMSLWQAARKAVAMNISDFAAKNVKPLVFLASLGLPREMTERNLKDIARGLNAGAREYDTYIVGGDTGEASDLTISLSLFGITEKNDVVLRSGAKPEDLVAVTGSFGNTSAGLRILLERLHIRVGVRQVLVQSVLMPRARLREGLILGSARLMTSSIDSSDGLAWSLHELAKASGVGFSISNVPISKEAIEFAETNNMNPLDLALYGGEEYELVITLRHERFQEAHKLIEDIGGHLTVIGKATKEKEIVLNAEGKQSQIEPRGYEHFKNPPVTPLRSHS